MTHSIEKRREYYRQNRERILKQQKEYQKHKTNLGHNRWVIYRKEQDARQFINNLIRYDKFPKAETQKCSVCDKQAEVWHHPNYEEKDKVVALCVICHNNTHNKLRETQSTPQYA